MDDCKEVRDAISHYDMEIKDNPEIPYAIAAVKALLRFLKNSDAETMSELEKNLNKVVKSLILHDITTSLTSGCELFVRFITLASIEQPDFLECRKVLISRGEKFVNTALKARKKISKFGQSFIKNGSKILTHSMSRVTFELLLEALENKKNFHVYVTESRPNMSGVEMMKKLKSVGISTTLIIDSAVAFIMEKIDVVIVGAEGVVENGGILNKIGTYQIAVMAYYKRVPVYVAVESFKFIRFYPLKQVDVPNPSRYEENQTMDSYEITNSHPSVDYTPPDCLTLLITDLGVLTPSGVSDELIKLYS